MTEIAILESRVAYRSIGNGFNRSQGTAAGQPKYTSRFVYNASVFTVTFSDIRRSDHPDRVQAVHGAFHSAQQMDIVLFLNRRVQEELPARCQIECGPFISARAAAPLASVSQTARAATAVSASSSAGRPRQR